MKRKLLFLAFILISAFANAQYPLLQYLGSDSTIVKSRGGLQGRFAPIPFTDTTSANLSRISQYPGALIYTSGVDKYWYRNATTTGWIEFTSSGGSTVNVYNSDGTLTGARILSGGNNSLTFDELVGFDVTSTSGAIQFNFFKSDGKSSYFVLGDTIKINPNLGNLLIDTLIETQDTSTYKPIVLDPITGRVLQSSYWYGGGGSGGSGIVSLGTSAFGLTTQNDSTYKVDTIQVSTRLWRQKGVDSVQSNLTSGLALKLNLADTASMLSPYLRKIDTTNKWITSVYRKTASDSVFYVKGGTATFAYRDSIGSGGGGGVTTIATINGTTKSANGAVISGSDFYMQTVDGTYPGLMTSAQKARLDSNSYLTIDKTYDSLAWDRNDSVRLTKSLRVQLNGVDVGKTITDSTLSYNITGTFGNDSAYVNAYLTVDSTALILVRDNNGQDTFHFRVDTTGWVFNQNIYNQDGTLTGARILSGGNNSLTFDELVGFDVTSTNGAIQFNYVNAGKTSQIILADTLKLNPILGRLIIDSLLPSMKQTDSVVVRDANGMAKSLSQWNLNGGQARTGFYLNSTKTWVKQVPYVFGTSLVFSGNSFANEGYTTGTPWPTQLTNYFSKTKVIRGRDADDLTGMIMRDYNSFHGRQSDSIAFCDVAYVQLMGVSIGGSPSGANYYADALDVTKTMNYIRGSWRSWIANYYLDIDTFSVNSLGDANFRAATSADSLTTKTTTGAIGLGAFSFTKPAGKTSVVIGTYGADGTRTHQGTIVVTNNGTEVFRKNYDSLNVANRGRDYKIKVGLNYEVIVLKDLPSAASTIEVTALNDSTRFDYIGYLVPADSAQKPLYINNLGYGYGSPGLSTQRRYIDSANYEIQNAVSDFSDYPVFINNYNRTLDSTVDINASRHLSSAGNDVVAEALLKNIVNIGYKPVITRGTAASIGSGTYYIGTYNSQTINGDGASIVGDSIYMQEFSAESPGLVPAGGSSTTYLRGDGTWQTVSGGGSPAGNFNNVQVNRNGSFAALASDSLSVSGSTLSSKLELSLIGATPTVNFGTAAGNPEIAATASALIFRRNDVGAYIDVTLGTLNANSFATTGNGSIAGKLSVTTGTNKSAGTGTLASGTATISTNNVTANSLIFIQYTSCSNCGSTYISAKTASTSFVVTSTNGADASTFNWWIIN